VFFFNGLTEGELVDAFERQCARAAQSSTHHRFARNYLKLRKRFDGLEETQRAAALDGIGVLAAQVHAGVKSISLNVRCLAPSESHCRKFFEQVRFQNFIPRHAGRGSSRQTCNTVSVVTRIDFGDTRILLGGDAEEEAWKQIVEKNSWEELWCHLLKVSHHGSSNGIPSAFFSRLLGAPAGQDRVAVIMPSFSHDLPEDAVVKTLRGVCPRVLITAPPPAPVPPDSRVRAHFVGTKEIRALTHQDAPISTTVVFDHKGRIVPEPWPEWVYF